MAGGYLPGEKAEKQRGQGSLLDLHLVSFLSVLGGPSTDHCGPHRLRHTIIGYDISTLTSIFALNRYLFEELVVQIITFVFGKLL